MKFKFHFSFFVFLPSFLCKNMESDFHFRSSIFLAWGKTEVEFTFMLSVFRFSIAQKNGFEFRFCMALEVSCFVFPIVTVVHCSS